MNGLYWLLPWEPSVTVAAATGVTALLFLRGCARCAMPWWRQGMFWAGLLSLYAALHTGFDYYAGHAFFLHWLQHGVLHHLGPFLIALSRPGAALAAGMLVRWRQYMQRLLNTTPMQRALAIMNHPALAVMLFCGLIFIWLLPRLHFIAMLDWRWYRVMNWSAMLDGLMFWNLALNAYALRPEALSPAARILMMLAVIPPQIVAGALLFLAPRELYSVYNICGRVFPGISPLADQQMGGLILWLHGAMMSVIGILVVMRREWMVRL